VFPYIWPHVLEKKLSNSRKYNYHCIFLRRIVRTYIIGVSVKWTDTS
jgi:hypothetical protein